MKNKRKQKPDKLSPLKCCYCFKVFRFKSEKIRHEVSHNTRYKCKVCNKDFGFISALKRHEKQHERSESVQCKVCTKKFKDEALLQRHIKYAHGDTYSCQICEAIFYSELALSSHKKSHKPASERVYHCEHTGCQKTFNFIHHLKHHQLVHEGTKQYFCQHCSKGFIQLHYLKSHLKSHEPDSWLECKEKGCSKKFVTDYALKKHMARHNRRHHTSRTPENTCNESSKEDCTAMHNIIKTTEASKLDLQLIEPYSNNTPGTVQPEADQSELILNDCRTALGVCIVSGDAGFGEDCLCSKLSINHAEDTAAFDEINTVNETNYSNEHRDNKCLSMTCNVSECHSRCRSNESAPKFEYKPNGAIKLINTFDLDVNIQTETNNNNYISSKIISKREPKAVPYNSCKAVLGKCIVSADGTMAEGCLCARMSCTDSQDVTEQQISELTITPNESIWN